MSRYEVVSYRHYGRCYRLFNDQIELLITAELGPRIIRFGFIGGENEFAEVDLSIAIPGHGTWRLYGGHRFWHAPEDMIRTYIPDGNPVEFSTRDDFLRVRQPIQPETGIEKELDISLASETAAVTVVHRLRNRNLWPVELGAWALSAMKSGGACIVPLPERKAPSPGQLPAISTITIWQYSDMSDRRFGWGQKYITVKQDPAYAAPQKIGALAPDGWAAYARDGHLFVKTFDFVPGAIYPDGCCSLEIFLNHEMLELETLGPLTRLDPGECIEHKETWHLYHGISAPASESDIDETILPIVRQLKASCD